MTFTCTKCGNYSDDGDFVAGICLRCIDDGADKDQEQREWHHIDVPTVRPLTPNEQKVYSLLRMGYTAKEVARQLHMPYGDEFFCNVHDVTCDTVRHLITSIREKGWDIPEKENEEGEDVQKYTDKQKEKALRLFDEGVSVPDIAKKLKINYKTVSKWTCDYKKQKEELDATDSVEKEWEKIKVKKEEPASAATDTDSGEKHFGNVSAPIIPENIEPVKSRYFSDDTCEAVKDKLHLLYAELDEVSNRMRRKYETIEKINASIAEDDAICNSIQFRIDEMEADLVIIAGGVIGE